MKPVTKRILTISASLAGIGIAMMGVGLLLGGRPGVVFNNSGIISPYQKKVFYDQKKVSVDAFSTLNLRLATEAEIKIQASEDENYYIEYQLNGEYEKPDYKVQDKTLYFSQADSAQSVVEIFNLGFDFQDTPPSYLILYIPEDAMLEYADIYNEYGNLSISDINFQTASIETNTGNIDLNRISGTDLNLMINDGNLTTNAVETDTFSLNCVYGDASFKKASLKNTDIQMETGNLDFQNCTTGTLKIVSQDGDVTLKDVASTDADFELYYGNLDFDSAALENLNCQMENGDVNLSLPENVSTYQFSINLEYGDLNLPTDASHERYQEEDGTISYQTEKSSKNEDRFISINSAYGNVHIN